MLGLMTEADLMAYRRAIPAVGWPNARQARKNATTGKSSTPSLKAVTNARCPLLDACRKDPYVALAVDTVTPAKSVAPMAPVTRGLAEAVRGSAVVLPLARPGR